MSFEDILNQWDTNKNKNISRNNDKNAIKSVKKQTLNMDSFIDLYPPDESISDSGDDRPVPNRVKRRNFRKMKIQETVDLHGFNIASAKVELEDFILRCKRKRIEKVLIIHGKGLHSEGGNAVLRTAVKNWLMTSSYIGEIGHPSEKEGGCGATWAIIKL